MSGSDDISLNELLAEVRGKKPDLQQPAAPVVWDPVRRRWLAVMFMLGASFRQIGRSVGRSPQSVNQSVDKEIPQEGRQLKRLALSMSWEALSHYTDEFYKQSGLLMAMEPVEAADWLMSHHPYNGE